MHSRHATFLLQTSRRRRDPFGFKYTTIQLAICVFYISQKKKSVSENMLSNIFRGTGTHFDIAPPHVTINRLFRPFIASTLAIDLVMVSEKSLVVVVVAQTIACIRVAQIKQSLGCFHSTIYIDIGTPLCRPKRQKSFKSPFVNLLPPYTHTSCMQQHSMRVPFGPLLCVCIQWPP